MRKGGLNQLEELLKHGILQELLKTLSKTYSFLKHGILQELPKVGPSDSFGIK